MNNKRSITSRWNILIIQNWSSIDEPGRVSNLQLGNVLRNRLQEYFRWLHLRQQLQSQAATAQNLHINLKDTNKEYKQNPTFSSKNESSNATFKRTCGFYSWFMILLAFFFDLWFFWCPLFSNLCKSLQNVLIAQIVIMLVS